MSWQAYVDDQICARIEARFACIASLADGSIWAKKEVDIGTPFSQAELKAIIDTMNASPAAFFEKGIVVGGEKFICISAENTLVRGRKQSSPLVIVATNKCLLVAAGANGFPAGQLNTVVEALGDYLKQNGY